MVYLSFSPQVMKFEPVPRYTGGSTPLYKPYRYVPPHREGVCAVSVWKRIYTLPILIWNRVWFSRELRTRVYERIYRFNERKKNMRIWNGFE